MKRAIRQPVLAAGAAMLTLVAGCGGSAAESGSATSADQETTSSVSAIDDPAVTAEALRTVNPCALLSDTTLAGIGTVAPDSHSESEWGVCAVDVTDANGKTAEMVLRVGDQLIMSDDPAEELAGLPLVVDDDDPESCWVSVVTSFETSLGITFQVDYPDGDPCAAGRTGLESVLTAIRDAPPRYEQAPGSVLSADPCAVADEKALATALGDERFVEPKGLHECDVWTGDSTSYPQVGVRFYGGLPEEGESVDLGGGVTAAKVTDEDDSVVSCDVTWLRVETPTEDEATGYGELVSVMVSGEPGDLDTAAACEKAVVVAKSVAPALG